MFYNEILFLVLLTFVPDSDLNENNPNIGGRDAKTGEYPSTACVYNSGRMGCYCTAAIVSTRKIITAAHCFKFYTNPGKGKDGDSLTEYPLDSVSALVGVVSIDDYGRQQVPIANTIYHSGIKYRRNKPIVYDLAIGVLSRELILKVGRVAVMKIPSADPWDFTKAWNDLSANGTTCASVGFGLTDQRENAAPSRTLKVIQVKPLSREECKKYQKDDEDLADYGLVCTSALVKGEGPCSAYSGSPLYCNNLVWGTLTRSVEECSKGVAFYYLFSESIKPFQLQGNGAEETSTYLSPFLLYALQITLFATITNI